MGSTKTHENVRSSDLLQPEGSEGSGSKHVSASLHEWGRRHIEHLSTDQSAVAKAGAV